MKNKFCLLLLIIAIFSLFAVQVESDKSKISKWALTNGKSFDKIEMVMFAPFWFRSKTDRFYRAESNGKVIYFKVGIIGLDSKESND
jgi:hypothetical protein